MIELPDHPPHGTGATAQLYEEVRRMTHDEALAVVIEAAGYWLDELSEYIIPASEAAEDGCDYQTGYDEIEKAIEVLTRRPDA